MDTFEKIRALLAEQLDVDPAKITLESAGRRHRVPAHRRRCGKLCGQPRAELILLGKSPAFAVRHTAVQADGALLWFVRNVKRLAHGLGRI